MLKKIAIYSFFIFFLCSNKLSFAHGDGEVSISYFDISQSIGGPDDDASDLQKKISQYEKKIAQLRSQEKTLQNQIDLLDDQISLIQLKIQAAEKSIAEKETQLTVLQDDIVDLSGKIVKLGNAVSYQTLLYNQRVRARYIDQSISPLEFIFSDGLSGIVQKAEYLRAVEEQDLRIIQRMKDTKKNYEDQKTLLEEKKAQVEKVKASIENEKARLIHEN